MFGSLADLCQLEQVEAVAVNLVEGICEGALQRRGRRKARTQRNVPAENSAEPFHHASALEYLPAYAEDVFCPLLGRSVLFFQAELGILVIVHGEDFDLVCPVGGYSGHYNLVYGSRKHIPSVVVCMLPYKVYPAGGGIDVTVPAEQDLELFFYALFHHSAK